MDDLISRQAAIDSLSHCQTYLFYSHDDDKKISLEDAEYELAHLPTAKPRKGRWIGIDDEPCEVWECDRCGHIVEVDATLELPNYCENCGARMEESE